MSNDAIMKSAIGKHIDIVMPTVKDLGVRYRMIRANGLITADYDPSRWNIQVAEDGVIEDIYFG